MTVIAIDQGTTSTRALTVDDEGRSRITRALAHRQYYPEPGRVEHDARELLANVRDCLASTDGVTAVGIDNQGESCLAWNADTGEPVGPVIVWQDNRTADSLERLAADGVGQYVMASAGLPLDSYFSASKLGWIVANDPEAKRLLGKGKLRLGTTDAFFLDRLAGRFVTDITTASRTSLMDLQRARWDPELCRVFGVPMECLPEIVPTTGHLGNVDLGGNTVPVTASVTDQQAALYGHGCRAPGEAKITFGTGAFALLLTGNTIHRAPDHGLLPTVAWQLDGNAPVYALDGGVYCAGSAIEWARTVGLFGDYAEINRFERPPAIERELAFVPALSGLACPHWDRTAAGTWIGLSLDTDSLDMVQSVLEGIALRAAEVISAMAEHTMIEGEISIDGGMSVNPYFCQFLADVLGRTVAAKRVRELTALGTAWLAGAVVPADESEDAVTRYQPRGGTGEAVQLFARAVARAGSWRRS